MPKSEPLFPSQSTPRQTTESLFETHYLGLTEAKALLARLAAIFKCAGSIPEVRSSGIRRSYLPGCPQVSRGHRHGEGVSVGGEESNGIGDDEFVGFARVIAQADEAVGSAGELQGAPYPHPSR